MIRTVATDNNVISYELTRKKVKNINLRIRRDGTVAVSCGRYVSCGQVDSFVKSKSGFILKAIEKTDERNGNSALPSEYKDGDSVSIYGQRYLIHIRLAPRRRITMTDTELVILTPKPDLIAERTRIYESWRRMELRAKVLDMCDQYYPYFARMGVKRPSEIKFRTMRSRWGCCRPDSGILTFSYNLFETPDEAIEYVVVHEFAHFLEANHSKRFYAVVASIMPDWKQRRKLLNDY